jgi:hypothetical protein
MAAICSVIMYLARFCPNHRQIQFYQLNEIFSEMRRVRPLPSPRKVRVRHVSSPSQVRVIGAVGLEIESSPSHDPPSASPHPRNLASISSVVSERRRESGGYRGDRWSTSRRPSMWRSGRTGAGLRLKVVRPFGIGRPQTPTKSEVNRPCRFNLASIKRSSTRPRLIELDTYFWHYISDAI